jgi:hypothetical protein
MHNTLSTKRRQVASAQPKHQSKDPYTQPSEPIFFPKVTDLFCRRPLPTLLYPAEAANLGDLMRYWYEQG